jgi:PAS domain S-box-containing protein
MSRDDAAKALEAENAHLRLRLAEAEQTLDAIRTGQVDSLVVEGPDGLRVYALEGASNSYRVLMEAMNEGAATLTEEGVILYCNNRFAQLLGGPMERVMGSHLLDRVPDRSRPTLEAMLRLAVHEECRGEVTLRASDGEEVPAFLSVNAIDGQGQRVLCMVATDLRAQQRSDAIVKEERLARSVLEQAAEAIVVCDEHGLIIRANRAAAELCGRNPLLSPFRAVFPLVLSDGEGEKEADLAAAALRGATFRAAAATLPREEGVDAQVLVSAAPLSATDEGPAGCVITMTDVTDARRAQETLRQSEERLRLALEGGALGTWDWDLRTQVFTGDARCCSVLGLEGQAPITLGQLMSVLHPEDAPRLLHAGRVAVREGTRFSEEGRILKGEGLTCWVFVQGRVFGQRGQAVRLSGTIMDVTAPKRTEAALREADRRKNQFLAVLSHELRNPLAPIKYSLEILQHAPAGGPQARRAEQVIDRQVTQLARLVDDLLDATRIARDKVELRRERLELNELVRKTVEDHQSLFDERGVRLEQRLSEGPVGVVGDRDRLSQVLGNLMQNAAKFTPPGGRARVSVSADAKDGRAVIRVTDDGVGIPEELLPHLFEPFSQADRTMERSQGGLGLGLALAKGLVELHGGEVRADSAGEGKGAEFTVLLPLAPGAPEHTAPLAYDDAHARRRILLIEDNVDSAETFRQALELRDHEVVVAHDGVEGITKAQQLHPDVVLCDLGLPLLDGYQVARALRADETLSDTLLVALSGYARPEDLARSREAGFDQHIAKPPTMAQLEGLLRHIPVRSHGP